MNKKILIIGLIIIAALAVAVFLIPKPKVQAPNSTETASWKTYRNDNCGFEVQIPKDWVLSNINKEAFPNLCEGFGFAPVGLKDIAGNAADLLLISINNSDFNKAAKDMYLYENGKWILDCLHCQGAQAYPVMTSTGLRGLESEDHIELDAMNGTVYRLEGFLTNEALSARFEMDGPSYKTDIASKPVFDQILSTFKFTK